jgi:hypothetical protein
MTLGELEQVVRTNPFSRQVIDNANYKVQNTILAHDNSDRCGGIRVGAELSRCDSCV